MKIGAKLNGAGEIVAVLRGLSKVALPENVLRAARAAALPVKLEMQRIVRKKSGELAHDIGIETLPDDQGSGAAVSVGPRSPVLFHRARLLQDGYLRHNKRTGNVSHIPGYAFVQPAADSKSGLAEAIFAREIARDVKGLD